MADDRLPVPVCPYGPIDDLATHLHDLTVKGRSADALIEADEIEGIAAAVGDQLTVGFVHQARMYALISLGRLQEALVVIDGLLLMHRASFSRTGEAKILSMQAQVLIKMGRTDEGLHALARSLAIIDLIPRENSRYYSVVSSVADGAQAAELYELADESARIASESFPPNSSPRAAGDLQRAELLLEWALRLDQLDQRDEAQRRFRLSVALVRPWVEAYQRDGAAEGADAPLATAILALALAKSGELTEGARLALALIGPTRAAGQRHEARLAHLAYGTMLRSAGDFPAARREFVAADEYADDGEINTQRLLFQFELAGLAEDEYPSAGASTMMAALRANAAHLWRLRLERKSMLQQAVTRVALEAEHDVASRAASQDALTGLGNRRSFDNQITALERRGTHAIGPVVLLLIDVDHFKQINDRYSHAVGDRVLREVATILRAHCRADDVPVRFGGDEFAVFLRADPATAASIGERIRQVVTGRDWNDFAFGLRVTLSLGLAVLVRGMTGRELFEAADKQLYVAKRQGRDRLVAAA